MTLSVQTVASTIFDLPNDRTGIKAVRIPDGAVTLGTSDLQIIELESEPDWPRSERFDFFRDEQPQHKVHVPAFAIGLTAVTNVQYLAFVESTGAPFPRSWTGLIYAEGQGEHPVVSASWHTAQKYCAWLSGITGLNCRLPTEAEWERAARGDDARLFPWGADFNPYRINTIEAYTRVTTPVFLHSPASDSPFGVVGLSGNSWEWTNSLFAPYPYDANDGREDPAAQGPRTVRGGSYMYSHRLARCAAREGAPPDVALTTIGFRIAIG